MIKVTRNEAFMLRQKGRGNDVHVHANTHYKSYYGTESAKTSAILEQYRKEHVFPVNNSN